MLVTMHGMGWCWCMLAFFVTGFLVNLITRIAKNTLDIIGWWCHLQYAKMSEYTGTSVDEE